MQRTDDNFRTLNERIERQEIQQRAVVPAPIIQGNFAPEMIVEAREQLGVDLTVELVVFFFSFNQKN